MKIKIIRWIIIFFGVVVLLWTINQIIGVYTTVSLQNTVKDINNNSKRQREEFADDQIYYGKLDSLIQVGLFNQALTLCSDELTTHPQKKAYINNDIGDIYREQGNLDSSIYFYTKAISQTNCYVKAFGNRGWIYYRLGLFDKSVKDLKFAADINHEYSLALGMAQEKMKLYNDAIQSYSNYLSSYPTDKDCKNKLDSLTLKIKNGL
ncbi:MAG TPA: tetratricopeptide repeat protein [Bacteroidia bacterium]|jgi:tetratricopeptide (TPR) repeat protein|nr:tetratricopeptide repeat protein [Bacteroidia bacterium]